MAFVSLSQNTITRIINRIAELKTAELRASGFETAPPPPALGDGGAYINALWGENIHLRGVVPEAWLEKIRRLDAQIKVRAPSGEVALHIEVQCPITPTHVPPLQRTSYYGQDYRDILVAEDDENFAAHWAYTRGRAEVASRWDKITAQIKEFLSACKSLNEAVKLYPDVMNYVPKDLREKLGSKAEKKARDVSEALAALARVEHDVVTTSTVLARMAGEKV